jgi:organic hydroperoxide reductase OsmC/OhrA
MLTQLARFAPLYEVEVDDATADVRATFRNTEKYDVDDAPPYFEMVTIRLAVDSPAPAAQVRELVRHAERACHAAQSLRHPVPVHLEARHNGAALED